MRKLAVPTLAGLLVFLVCSSLATQALALKVHFDHALGRPLFHYAHIPFYAPLDFFKWKAIWGARQPELFQWPGIFVFAGAVLGGGVFVRLLRANWKQQKRPFGLSGWANRSDIKRAGLLKPEWGIILGKRNSFLIDEELLIYSGPGHVLLLGGTRTGKGRGQVIPTALWWGGSLIALDVKGEIADGDPRLGFEGTSGMRAKFSQVVRFAPTQTDSARINPLWEVRKGPNEVRDIQNIVDIITTPVIEGREEPFWRNSASKIITGVIVDLLYSEPDERKNLAVVAEKLSTLNSVAEEMLERTHRLNALTGLPETHPAVKQAAESYLSLDERTKSNVRATAEAYFGLFADELIALNTSESTFRIGDLMCLDYPVTLYLQPPPSDVPRLMPLMRIIISLITRGLMESQTHDTSGRVKKHKLLLLLDEFPQLGRLPGFETAMGTMAGYGIQAVLVCQSLNHVRGVYGRDNVILDNCDVVSSFATTDPETAKKLSDMAGDAWEVRPQETHNHPGGTFDRHGSVTMREERRPLLPPSDVRTLPRDEELLFVSGAKPIRCKKLRYDSHFAFKKMLLPKESGSRVLTTAHDWAGVRAIEGAPARSKSADAYRQAPNSDKAPIIIEGRVISSGPASSNDASGGLPRPTRRF